ARRARAGERTHEGIGAGQARLRGAAEPRLPAASSVRALSNRPPIERDAMLLEDKVVVVTGASRGIGRAVAVGCAQQGADVVVNFDGPEGGAEQTLAEIRALGRRGLAQQGDIADPETAKSLIDAAVAQFGGVDVCVANAGICPFHAFLDLPPELLRRTLGVNF